VRDTSQPMKLDWFLPTGGDSRDLVASGDDSHQRPLTFEYLATVARNAEQLADAGRPEPRPSIRYPLPRHPSQDVGGGVGRGRVRRHPINRPATDGLPAGRRTRLGTARDLTRALGRCRAGSGWGWPRDRGQPRKNGRCDRHLSRSRLRRVHPVGLSPPRGGVLVRRGPPTHPAPPGPVGGGDRRDVIGADGDLPPNLPAELRAAPEGR
jgi:hypothetical protein